MDGYGINMFTELWLVRLDLKVSPLKHKHKKSGLSHWIGMQIG